jgi:iron complex transport system ATP-binding protein
LTGLQPPLGGEIFYNARNIRDYSRMELAQKVGYISTEIVKVSNMRVYDLVALGRFPHTNWIGKIELIDHEIILDALKKTSMEAFGRKFVSELSDGERQKSMIARILAQDTSIMVMDEPTAFLDVAGKYDILHLMHLLSRNNGKTIIFSTHDLQMAISQSDKIWLMLDNKLIEGAPEDLMMAGAFDHLFDSSSVLFNSDDGTFSFRSDARGAIYIEGEGNKRRWTEKAVNRAGFTVAKEKTFPYITLPSESNLCWQLSGNTSLQEFSSVYELILYLSNESVRLI